MIVGIDSSLTAFGLCAIPAAFSVHDWNRLKMRTVVTKPGSCDADRFAHIARCAVSFCAAMNADAVFIEDVPSLLRSKSTKRLTKLSGVVEHELRKNLGLEPTLVNISSARKLLLGSVPRGELAKVVVFESCRSFSPLFEDDAQADAFAVANYGRSEMGLWAVSAT